MNVDGLQRVGDKIELRLKEIRERVGAPISIYSVNPVNIDISGQKLQELAEANPGKPIIRDGEYCIAYIKDHIYHGVKFDHDSDVREHPNRCFVRGNKVHFYYCSTLLEMTAKGRQSRYRQTSRIDNIRLIDLQDAKDVKTRLAWCKNCIKILQEQDISGAREAWRYRSQVAEYANARELIDCVKSYYNNEPSATRRAQDFYESVKMTTNREK